jgi:ABC-2 type transport system permease protein
MQTETLLRKTFRDVRGATIGIATLAAVMALVDLLIYPSYRDSLQDFQMPEVMQGFLGSEVSIDSPAGFVSAEFFSWIPLVLMILAIAGGTAAFAGEEAAGTMDLLLAQPIRRRHLALAKTAALAIAISLAALSGLVGFAVGKRFTEFDIGMGRLAVTTISMIPVTLLFLGLSLWVSARLPSRGMAAMLVTGLVVIAYFIQILGEAAPALRTIRKLSPFYWSEPSRVLLHGFDWSRTGVMLLLATIAVAAAVRSFERRDITTGTTEWHLRDLKSIRSSFRGRAAASPAPSIEGR